MFGDIALFNAPPTCDCAPPFQSDGNSLQFGMKSMYHISTVLIADTAHFKYTQYASPRTRWLKLPAYINEVPADSRSNSLNHFLDKLA